MQIEKKEGAEKVGKIFGYAVVFFIFTSVLYLILLLTKKLPESWTVLNVAGVTFAIFLAGKFIRFLLK